MISEKMRSGMKINRGREVTNVVLTYNDGTVQVIPANPVLCQAAESMIRDTGMADEMTAADDEESQGELGLLQ